MKLTFLVLCVCFMSGSNLLWAQSKVPNKHLLLTTKEDKEALNQKDAQGRKQGLWYIEHKARMGEDAFIEFGRYTDNAKQGLWYRMDVLGHLIFIKTFSDGVLNGTSQYYDKGNLVCIGNFRGLNAKYAIDSIWVTDPMSGYDTLVMVPSSQGSVKHGLWRYYNAATGQLIKEESYQVGSLLYRKTFHQSVVDSDYTEQRPQHRPIDIKRATRKVPDYAKQKIGY